MWDPAESRTVLIGGKWWGHIGRWSTPVPSSLSIPWGLQSTPGSRFLQAQLHLSVLKAHSSSHKETSTAAVDLVAKSNSGTLGIRHV